MALESINFSHLEPNINNGTAIISFLTITIVFTIIKFVTNAKYKMPWTIAYLLIIIIVQYFVNMSLTDKMCGESAPGFALKITLIPWLLIFGIITILLMIFPGWLRPFSNTIGYLFVKASDGEKIIDDVFKNPSVKDNDSSESEDVKNILGKILENKMLIINEITETNFATFWDKMNKAGLLKPEANTGTDDKDSLKNQLLNLVVKKNIIAESIWYILSGILVIAIVSNYIINSDCQVSVKTQKEQQQQYDTKAEETDYGTTTGQCLA
jgi:hypothetical protein